MTVTTNPDRIAPSVTRPPMTDADMVALWTAGEPLASIAAKAYRRNGIGKPEVRRIVLGVVA